MPAPPDTLSSRLERALSERPPQTPDLSAAFPGFRRAAVLVPLLHAPGGLELLFTVRSAGLAHGAVARPAVACCRRAAAA